MELNERIKNEITEGKIINGESITVRCSSCNAPLVQVWITRPNSKLHTKLTAACPHCGDKSFVHEIDGAFALGHTKYTSMIDSQCDYETHDDYILQIANIKTTKGKKTWKNTSS